jgi:hypothetical protein
MQQNQSVPGLQKQGAIPEQPGTGLDAALV